MTYNGWTNYATWAVNDHGFFNEEWIENAVKRLKGSGDDTNPLKTKSDEKVMRLLLADEMQDYFENWLYTVENYKTIHLDGINQLLQNFILYALDDVDWNDLAESYWQL